ncbi:helix-turn-helix domain-containing protein [Actinoplanes sp. TBRC 11911]|uniref:helix-turn-helix transcriptional regulator n=1 Tax=Actinoplanes sp. TBRC 11911 TaxID=2729386 RepID=UPI00145C4FE5|nr:helix-turn-helix domain-containing protein [Actinoplanes sp. TBRC 11911]NMO52442.1 helix-turn-helix domain-containing protein [Actinoplanes sp. TBRC 11911]
MNAHLLAEFLKARRVALSPHEVGLSASGRRRTPGLRREEVAALAGVSTDYYTRLEQQRATAVPSEVVVSSLVRALRLSQDERDHLYRLTGHPVPDRHRDDQHVAPALLRALDALADIPARVMTDLGATLAQNKLAHAVFGPASKTSFIYQWFCDPAARNGYPAEDHAAESRALVADLRAAVTRRDDDPARSLVAHLLADSPEFTALWNLHDVAVLRRREKRILHPEVGLLQFDCQFLIDENRSQLLALFSPLPATPTADRLTLLALATSTDIGG